MDAAELRRLFSLDQFNLSNEGSASQVTYRYEGICPRSGFRLSLPRTRLAEHVARGLMVQLDASSPKGKMYGVLLVDTPWGHRVLKAVSGHTPADEGTDWVPPIPQPQQLILSEFEVVSQLDQIKAALTSLAQLPARTEYTRQAQAFAERLARTAEDHRQRKERRDRQRRDLQPGIHDELLAALDDESRRDSTEKRRLKQARDRVLDPLKQAIDAADEQIRALKRRRRQLSRQLQTQMHAVYALTNFAGERRTLSELLPHQGLPTGTGECCAPKLLHYAATHGLTPLAMAEFWWEPTSAEGSRVHGEFYGACPERCQPIMGFLLSGLPRVIADTAPPPRIIYEDRWLIAVDKPAGLLSTPGRTVLNPNSAVSQVQAAFSDTVIQAVHRLDQDTSGVLLLSRSPQVHRHISDQFRQRRVSKRYAALVTATVTADQGNIHLPIGRYPDCRPQRRVDWTGGKPSHTRFAVLGRYGGRTRLELLPTTGRTHQLRVHLAAAEGLGAPILGDRIYGGQPSDRLHLHACTLTLRHPELGESLKLSAEAPF